MCVTRYCVARMRNEERPIKDAVGTLESALYCLWSLLNENENANSKETCGNWKGIIVVVPEIMKRTQRRTRTGSTRHGL